MKKLPIYDVLDEIKTTLNSNSKLIVEAPPGAGKSAQFFLFLYLMSFGLKIK